MYLSPRRWRFDSFFPTADSVAATCSGVVRMPKTPVFAPPITPKVFGVREAIWRASSRAQSLTHTAGSVSVPLTNDMAFQKVPAFPELRSNFGTSSTGTRTLTSHTP
ncbi:hypothetical protein DIPPA_23990 [Diplonema papillatum]|nr:hypothetical protein DIPPA_23990 [Diplonema papillatum]